MAGEVQSSLTRVLAASQIYTLVQKEFDHFPIPVFASSNKGRLLLCFGCTWSQTVVFVEVTHHDVEPTNATLVVYAAKEGTTALDGTGADSPFAVSFARRVTEPGLEINKTFRFVRQDVLDETGNRQEPFVYGSLPPEDFYFVPGR